MSPLISSAETTRYVSDQLEITMRNGQGVKFAIKRVLTSGDRLDLIEADSSGYSKVRTIEGVEGWVLTRYLMNAPSVRNLVADSAQKVANLELELAETKEELKNVSTKVATSDSKSMALKETSQRFKKELDSLKVMASSSIALSNENIQLKEKIQQTDIRIQGLVLENTAMKNSDSQSWFLTGVAVLLGGIILGLILPRLRLQRKNSWGNI
jgi:SH3 domain protein|tara:strand:+ start:247 stop:879 length:633 start_codon:yes stop_codon:yes gene_type:complete